MWVEVDDIGEFLEVNCFCEALIQILKYSNTYLIRGIDLFRVVQKWGIMTTVTLTLNFSVVVERATEIIAEVSDGELLCY